MGRKPLKPRPPTLHEIHRQLYTEGDLFGLLAAIRDVSPNCLNVADEFAWIENLAVRRARSGPARLAREILEHTCGILATAVLRAQYDCGQEFRAQQQAAARKDPAAAAKVDDALTRLTERQLRLQELIALIGPGNAEEQPELARVMSNEDHQVTNLEIEPPVATPGGFCEVTPVTAESNSASL